MEVSLTLHAETANDKIIPIHHNPSHASVSYPLLNTSISNHPTATHIKCIGAVMDKGQGKAIEQALVAERSEETVPVKIEPEPTNPYDSKAIYFKC